MPTALDALRRDHVGAVIEPGMAEYDLARRTPLAWGDPDVVLRPLDVDDVRCGVRFVAATGLPLAVRGGGHSFPGFGTVDGGVVMDLSALAEVEVLDTSPGRVRVGGGATWGQVAAALAPHDLVISSGDTAGVGVGGLTLSGGVGWMVRRDGLTLDALTGAEVVTADGELLVVDRERHADLFWAIRGGGGNFGIVTSFEFGAQAGGPVWFGRILFPADEVATVLPAWAAHMRHAPRELTTVLNLANPAAGGREAPVEIVVAVSGANEERAARLLEPLRQLGTVVGDDIAPHRYQDILIEQPMLPPGLKFAVRNALVSQRGTARAVEVLAEVARGEAPPVISVRSIGGALSQIAPEATAFAHRSAELMITTMTAGPAAIVDAAESRIDRVWSRLTPHVDGAYPNFLSTATERDVATAYPPDTLRRLREIKRAHDPGNMFARNHNVLPERASERAPASTSGSETRVPSVAR